MKKAHVRIVDYLKWSSIFLFVAICVQGGIVSLIEYEDSSTLVAQLMFDSYALIAFTCSMIVYGFAEFLRIYFDQKK